MVNARTSTTNSADGTEIAIYDFGGDGPDLLLGHATGFCAMVWSPVIEVLREHFRCVGYDLRGHGLSGKPRDKAGWDWNNYAQDAKATIEALGLTKPFSVGHSCGAATALLLEQANPGTFSSMIGFEPVMFDAIPPTGPDEDRELAKRTLRRRTDFETRRAALSNYTQKGPFTKLHPAALEAYVEYGFRDTDSGTVALRCEPADEAAVYVMASAHNGFVDLETIECPVTVVHGAESNAFDAALMQKVAARIRQGSFVSMKEAGHFGALEHPGEFTRLTLRAFRLDVSTRR